MPAGLTRGLHADAADEAKAVRDYGTRQRQSHAAGRHGLAKRLRGIQRDEQRHHRIVARAAHGKR